MAKIRIIKTPPGEAPLWVRQAWLGLEIPLINVVDPEAHQIGAQGGPATPENIGGYEVHGSDALQALYQAGQGKAAGWWLENSRLGGGHLVFAQTACVLIQDVAEATCLRFIMGPRTAHPWMRLIPQIRFIQKDDRRGVAFLSGEYTHLPQELTIAREENGATKTMPILHEAFAPEGEWCLVFDGKESHRLFLPEKVIIGEKAIFQYTAQARIPDGRGRSGLIDPDIQMLRDRDNGFCS